MVGVVEGRLLMGQMVGVVPLGNRCGSCGGGRCLLLLLQGGLVSCVGAHALSEVLDHRRVAEQVWRQALRSRPAGTCIKMT